MPGAGRGASSGYCATIFCASACVCPWHKLKCAHACFWDLEQVSERLEAALTEKSVVETTVCSVAEEKKEMESLVRQMTIEKSQWDADKSALETEKAQWEVAKLEWERQKLHWERSQEQADHLRIQLDAEGTTLEDQRIELQAEKCDFDYAKDQWETDKKRFEDERRQWVEDKLAWEQEKSQWECGKASREERDNEHEQAKVRICAGALVIILLLLSVLLDISARRCQPKFASMAIRSSAHPAANNVLSTCTTSEPTNAIQYLTPVCCSHCTYRLFAYNLQSPTVVCCVLSLFVQVAWELQKLEWETSQKAYEEALSRLEVEKSELVEQARSATDAAKLALAAERDQYEAARLASVEEKAQWESCREELEQEQGRLRVRVLGLEEEMVQRESEKQQVENNKAKWEHDQMEYQGERSRWKEAELAWEQVRKKPANIESKNTILTKGRILHARILTSVEPKGKGTPWLVIVRTVSMMHPCFSPAGVMMNCGRVAGWIGLVSYAQELV